jgi:hypothetical protein
VSGAERPSGPARGAGLELALLLGAFVAGTLLAELLGAANLGTALTFGTIALMIAILAVMLRR